MPIGAILHIPASVWPEEDPPPLGYWVGKAVHTRLGGLLDVGIKLVEEGYIITQPHALACKWMAPATAPAPAPAPHPDPDPDLAADPAPGHE